MIEFESTVAPLKGGSYFGAHDPAITSALEPLRNRWLASVDNASSYSQNKTNRDGTSDLHVTVVSPPEMRELDRAEVEEAFGDIYSITALGVGTISRDKDQTWYVILDSPELQAARRSLGLTSKDLHATLGFVKRDLFTRPKTYDTIIGELHV